jgi:Ferritin-like
VTIGQFYAALDTFLSTLPSSDWKPGRNQIGDSQFFAGQLFPINNYDDAHQAIGVIVSEGEGTPNSPLDFQHEIAHYFRFGECFHNLVLTKADNPQGYQWGPETLGIDWSAVYAAIPDPETHDFSKDPPAAQAAQAACNQTYTQMVDALRLAVTGHAGQLGIAVRAMFELRTAAYNALTTPLADPTLVAGPSFLYSASKKTGASS